MGRLPRFPLTVFDNIYARGHQSLARDHLEYCQLAVDRQRRSYDLVREQHLLTVARIHRRNASLSNAYKTPIYKTGDWVWVYNSASTVTQGSKAGATASSNADATVLKVKLALNWTGPFKILEVGPTASAPDKRPLADKVLYLDLPTDMPGANAKPRVTVERCKPCLGQDDADRPRFMPAGLSRYVLNKYSDKSPPYHVLDSDVRVEDQRFDVEKITGHQEVRGRGGVIAVLYETHWKGLLRTYIMGTGGRP